MSESHRSIPPIHFAPTRGGRLAYQAFGSGPPTIVSIPPMAQNIELAWERPEIRAMLERFGTFSRFVCFDKRGTGASARRSGHVSGIDERVEDLRAVMDHADIESAHFFANSEGGPMAILFAVTYPDRVESLCLWGSGASMMPPNMTDEQRAERESSIDRYVPLWGTPQSPVVDGFAPSLAADQSFRTWHQRYERNAASTDSLRDLLELTLDMDVREVLPELHVPTLVLHRTGDRIVPIAFGREVAEQVPDARIVEYEGDDHFAYAGDIDGWMTELERFVTGDVMPRPARTVAHPQVRIVTLGRFAVQVDGRDVPATEWGSRLSRQLCKRLVAARGWPVTRDELIDQLWPDEHDLRRLGARLSVQLSAVRRVLGGGVIADRQSVRLDLDEISTDLEEFYAASDDGAVLAAYPGEFLPEDRYDDWTAAPRDEARARFVTAARRLADRAFSTGASLRAVEYGRRLIDVDKYDERAHRLVVDVLTASGEIGEARRAHEAWVAAMAELDVEVAPFEQPRNS